MASNRLPGAIDRLRQRRGGAPDQGDVTAALRALQRDLDDLIEDPNDRARIDTRFSDVLNAIGATQAPEGPGEDDEGEAQGERLTASGQAPTVGGRHGFDYSAPRGMGMDRAPVVERSGRRTPAGLATLFAEVAAPKPAGSVR